MLLDDALLRTAPDADHKFIAGLRLCDGRSRESVRGSNPGSEYEFSECTPVQGHWKSPFELRVSSDEADTAGQRLDLARGTDRRRRMMRRHENANGRRRRLDVDLKGVAQIGAGF